MTREQFLLQAESLKPGLTEEQFIQAVVKDVNTCEYLAAQNQMYSVEELAGEWSMDYIEGVIKGRVTNTIKSMKEKPEYGKEFFEHALGNMSIDFEADDLVPGRILYPFEFAYLFLRHKDVKEIIERLKLTQNEFVKEHLMCHMFPFDGYTPIKAETDPPTEEPVVVEQSTMEEVLDSPEIQEVIKSASDEVSAAYDMVMSHIGDITKENVDGLISTIGKDIVDKIRNGEQTAESLWKDLVGKIVNREEISGGAISEKAWDCIMQKISESGIARKVIEFANEDEVSSEEVCRILKILFSPEIQEKLKKYKARNNKNGCTYKEIPDFDYDRQKFNFAFMVDSMFKEKKIVILLNSNGTSDGTEIFLQSSKEDVTC